MGLKFLIHLKRNAEARTDSCLLLDLKPILITFMVGVRISIRVREALKFYISDSIWENFLVTFGIYKHIIFIELNTYLPDIDIRDVELKLKNYRSYKRHRFNRHFFYSAESSSASRTNWCSARHDQTWNGLVGRSYIQRQGESWNGKANNVSTAIRHCQATNVMY